MWFYSSNVILKISTRKLFNGKAKLKCRWNVCFISIILWFFFLLFIYNTFIFTESLKAITVFAITLRKLFIIFYTSGYTFTFLFLLFSCFCMIVFESPECLQIIICGFLFVVIFVISFWFYADTRIQLYHTWYLLNYFMFCIASNKYTWYQKNIRLFLGFINSPISNTWCSVYCTYFVKWFKAKNELFLSINLTIIYNFSFCFLFEL